MNNFNGTLISDIEKIDINKHYEYSLSDSFKVFEIFIRSTSYTDITKKALLHQAKNIHNYFPHKEWLQNSINTIGLHNTAKQISNTYSKVSPYLYFLAMVKVIKINFKDYYLTNPTTLMRIHKWYKPYYSELGIDDALEEIEYIVENTKNKSLNLERCKKISLKTLLYLVLKYNLKTIYQLECSEWNEFIAECRRTANENKSTKDISTYTNNELLQIVFANLNIFKSVLPTNKNNRRRKKDMVWKKMPNIKPVMDIFVQYGKVKWKKCTLQRYENNLNLFFEYLIKKYDINFDLSKLKRKDIIDYINKLYADVKNGIYGYSNLQNKVLNLKTFLIFVSEHESELKKEKLLTFKGKIVINDDFKTPNVKSLPRPINNEVLNALLDTLRFIDNKIYKLSFMIMLTTGIAKIDLINLKNDCIRFDKDNGNYYLSYFRVKVKKELIVKIQSDAAKLIMAIQKENTQKVATQHPDGSNTIFLINDGGKKVDISWFDGYVKKHKELAMKRYRYLENEISSFTAHRLRHTFATIMRDKGADILTLKYLLGHESIVTTSKYVKESDKRKIEVIDNLRSNNYCCDSFTIKDNEFLNSKRGLQFIDRMLSHENNLLIGKCTVDGGKNCPMAYKCLDCIYLCSTKEDLEEMIEVVNILKNQYITLEEKITKVKSKRNISDFKVELNKTKRRINILCKKISKIQQKSVEKDLYIDNLQENNSILSFIDE